MGKPITINRNNSAKRCGIYGQPNGGYKFPKITQEQIEAFLYSGIGGDKSTRIQNILNEDGGYTDASYSFGLVATPAEPAKPMYAPVTRKVRSRDLEVGCTLLVVGAPIMKGWRNRCVYEKYLGKEVEVSSVSSYGSFTIKEFGDDSFTDTSSVIFSFVSNPNYILGIRIGTPMYSTRHPRYHGKPLTRWEGDYKPEAQGQLYFGAGLHVPGSWTTDETKSIAYLPPVVTYKVRDGEVQEGGAMWWLGNEGPHGATMSPGSGDYSNCKAYPQVYQLAEPEFDLVRVPGSFVLVKAYRYMQAPYNGDSEAYYAAIEQVVPGPGAWRVGDILRVISNKGDWTALVGTEGPILSIRGAGTFVTYKIEGSSQFAERYEWVRRP